LLLRYKLLLLRHKLLLLLYNLVLLLYNFVGQALACGGLQPAFGHAIASTTPM